MKQQQEKHLASEKYSPEIHRQMIEAAKEYSSSNNLGQITVHNPERYKAFREGQDSGYSIATQTKIRESHKNLSSPSTHEERKFMGGQWEIINGDLWAVFSKGHPMQHKIRLAQIDGASEEAEANAALIAESKNLYEALKSIVNDWIGEKPFQDEPIYKEDAKHDIGYWSPAGKIVKAELISKAKAILNKISKQ